jgi:hypothetical protein
VAVAKRNGVLNMNVELLIQLVLVIARIIAAGQIGFSN